MAASRVSAAGPQSIIAVREYADMHLFAKKRLLSKSPSSRTLPGDGLVRAADQTTADHSSSSVPSNEYIEAGNHSETVLYLAYGSNLATETFGGRRGIKPLSQVNVVVPELRLTFDLPGIPYSEPCFANTNRRHHASTEPKHSEKASLILGDNAPGYHKDRWKKGLVGVVYEVTKEDFAIIIATEGGGAAYQDVLVTCYPLSESPIVPEHPDTQPFEAHTLLAPETDPSVGRTGADGGGRVQRPDPSYAQPSARYLKLIRDGAEEHNLPSEYTSYLCDIRPFTITQNRQWLGQFILLAVWLPILLTIFGAGALFKDKEGKSPAWFVKFSAAVFRAIWASYDGFFKKLFGEGERTIQPEEDSEILAVSRRRTISKGTPECELLPREDGGKSRRYDTFAV
ncbi:MAG: hypothetical protein M1837_007133 [Sclerophora amabilis]|nr:MAG: hypothetical protein M1837_007133 [Sclerophora amabilis]